MRYDPTRRLISKSTTRKAILLILYNPRLCILSRIKEINIRLLLSLCSTRKTFFFKAASVVYCFFFFRCQNNVTIQILIDWQEIICFVLWFRQGVSPLYVGLNPGPYHLASALHHLLLANDWLPMTLVVDDSLDAQKIRRAVQLHSSAILGTQHNTSNAHKTSSSDLAKPKVNNQSNLFFSFFFSFSK